MTAVQFNVVVVDALLQQDASGTEDAQLVAKLTFAGEEAPVACQPVRSSGLGAYQLNYRYQFKRKVTNNLLATLVNQRALVSLADADTGQLICSGSLDLAFLALGESSAVQSIRLEPCSSSTWVVLPGSTATLSVQVQQLAANEGNNPDATSQSEQLNWAPYALVPEDDKELCNLLEVSIKQLGTLPPKLQAAADMAGGRLACSLALSFEGVEGPTTLAYMPAGSIRAQQLSWDKPLRVPLTAAAARSLLYAVEDGRPLHAELARYLQPGAELFHDPAFAAYHGYGRLSPSELLVPGAVNAVAQLLLSSTFTAAQGAGRAAASALPPYTPPSAPKAKPIEEAPAPLPDGQVPCMWGEAGTSFALELRLWKPLVAPWRPPPAPDARLEDLVPRREFATATANDSALQRFQHQIKSIATSLAKEYHATLGGTSAASCPPGASGAGQASAVKQQLVFQLNHSGKYLQLREALKTAVVELVKEQFTRGSAAGAGEGAAPAQERAAVLHHRLFAQLLDEMHAALSALAAPALSPPSTQDEVRRQMGRLKALADEAEVAGQMARAQALHQRRVVLTDKADAQAWYDYACACMRARQHGRAEECLRQAISVDPEHAASLVGLTAVCLHQGAHTDAQHFQTAEVVGQALKDMFPENPVAWAVLQVVYIVQGSSKAAEAKSCYQEVARLAQVAAVWGQSPAEQNPYMQATLLLLDLHLPDEALHALDLCQGLKDTARALHVDTLLCRARAAQLLGNEEAALEALKEASRSCEPSDIRAAVLGGKLHMQAGHVDDAVRELSTAYHKQPARCPLELYLQLGRCYLRQGQQQYARNVLLQATAASPCASTWAGLAAALYAAGDLDGADLALTEANVLDPGNPAVWGQLALVALAANRVGDAEKALQYSFKEGLEDEALMLELGQTCLDRGLAPMAQSVLARALSAQDGVQVRCALARALLVQSKQEEARQHYLAALELITGPEEHDQVQRALEALQPFA